MTLALIVEGVALLLLLGCSAFFSSAETALFALNPIHIHRIGRRHPASAERLRDLLARPSSLLSTILIGNTIVNVTASALGFTVAEGPDVETRAHNFDSLNTAPHHPSLDPRDTFWLETGELLRRARVFHSCEEIARQAATNARWSIRTST